MKREKVEVVKINWKGEREETGISSLVVNNLSLL
jgi:hypothetical protein